MKANWVASNILAAAWETAVVTEKTATKGHEKKEGIKPSPHLRRPSINGGLDIEGKNEPARTCTSPAAMRPLINVLLCNDDPVDSKLIRAYLQRLTDREIVVVEARDHDEIQDALDHRRIDLVLVGPQMGRKSGSGWLATIAKQQLAPIVVLTGPSTEQGLVQSYQNGTLSHLADSDLSPDKLRNAIDIALDSWARSRQVPAGTGGLESLAAFDSLTGLYNRGAVLTKLRELISVANRYKDAFSLIMLDIDCIKAINDRHGHLARDDVLKKIASLVRQNVRDSDIVGRWAADAFVIIVRRAGLSSAWVVAERLRTLIQQLEMNDAKGTTFPITVSLGVVEWEQGEDACSLIRRADEALYRAKQKGRSRVQILLGPRLRNKI